MKSGRNIKKLKWFPIKQDLNENWKWWLQREIFQLESELEEEEVAAKQELSTDKDAAKQFLVEMV